MKTLISVFSIVMVSFTLVYFAADAGAETAFSPGIDYVSTNPAFIASGDLNNDAWTDLIVANWSSNTITVFLGNADGTFTAQTPVSTGGANAHPNSIATGYFNADSNLDLAVANGGGIRDIVLMFGDGLGGFSGVTSLDVSVGGYPNGDADINFIASGDFDNDGETDLALSKNTGYYPTINDHIKIMKGDGSGGFTPLSSTDVGNSATGPYGLATGFFNDDTNLDLAVTLYDSGTLKILLGDGSGGFTDASGSPITVGIIPLYVVNADLNNDGEADLIVTNFSSNAISILLGNGDGTFTAASGSPLATGAGPNGLAAALIDADGIPDLIVANTGASTFSVFAGNGDGTFQSRKDFATGAGPGFLVARDFDADGKTDIAIAHSSINKVSVYLQTECTPPPSGMVSWWGGDNNALDMVSQKNGTLMGNTAYAPGIVGQAFSFDGAEASFVEIADSSAFNPSGAFTLDGWFFINPDAAGNAGEIATFVSKTHGNSTGWQLIFDDRAAAGFSKSVRFVLFAGGYIEAVLNNAIPSQGWYHIAGVFDPGATPQAKLFLNGVQAASSTGTIGAVSPNDYRVRIGAMNWTEKYGEGNDRLNGKADEVEIFSRALSSNEIAAIYNAGSAGKCRACTAPPTDMVSWWGGDNNALDMVGANDGMLIGGATFAPGKIGQAFSFAGNGDFVDAGNDAVFNFSNGTGDFTIDAWINIAQFSTWDSTIITKATMNPFTGWSFYVYADGRLAFGGAGVWEFSSAAGAITTGSWFHVAVTKSGGTYKLLKNGVEVASASHGNLQTSAASLTIGTDFHGLNQFGDNVDLRFNGLIDEVEIFNRALSADEIGAIYNAGSAGKCAIDRTPADFSFTPVSGVQPGSTQQISFTVSGINYITPISITGGEYAIGGCGGPFTSDPGTVNNGDIVCVRVTTSMTAGGTSAADLTVGSETRTFTATTIQYYARVTPGPKNYSASLAAAYAGATLPGDIIEAYEHSFDEELDCNGGQAVTLNGGYNAAFDLQVGWSTLNKLTISGTGGLTVSGIVVQ